MKTIFLLTMLSLLFLTCNRNVNKELSEEEKATIISDITRTFEIAGEGITELDAEKAFSAFSKKEGTKYIRDGHLYPDIETAKKQYAEWFKSPDAVKRVTTYDTLIFDILDENTVLMTSIGSLWVIGDTTGQKPWVIAYTGLWRKEDVSWSLMNMHNSWE
jgi:hypothetical protein